MTAALTADFKTIPYRHQLLEFERSAEMPARALLWQMRTGKTKVIVDTACHLKQQRLIDTVIVVAPNGVHSNWTRRELPKHHWDTVQYQAMPWNSFVAGTSADNLIKTHGITKADYAQWQQDHEAWWDTTKDMLATDLLSWWSFNSESMTRDDVRRLLARIVRRRKSIMIVFDEAHDFRTPGSKRTKMARALAHKCSYRRLLTGTTVTNSPLHAYSQFELLEQAALGYGTYGEFKDHFAEYTVERTRQGRSYPKLKEFKNLDELRDAIGKLSSVILREDCEDLPDVVKERRDIALTEEQRKLYQELHHKFTLEVGGKEISIGENAARFIKLQQVVSGFIKDEFGVVHDVPGGNPRLEALVDEVTMCKGKVIIWCQFHHDLDAVAARMKEEGIKAVEYHGRVSSKKKDAAEDAFRDDPDVKVIIGQPQSGGQGLDMSAADMIVWYSHTMDAIVREQAMERATAMGGKNIRSVDLVAPGIDGYFIETTEGKVDVADTVAGRGLKLALERVAI